MADTLDEFPELKFPADRALLTPKEIASKLRCSVEQVIGYVDDGSLRAMPITARGTQQKRTHLRIPVSNYYALVRRRFGDGWNPNSEPDPKQPELF